MPTDSDATFGHGQPREVSPLGSADFTEEGWMTSVGWDMLVALLSADLTWQIQRLLGLEDLPRELVQRSAREAVCEARSNPATEDEPYVAVDAFFRRIRTSPEPALAAVLRSWGEVAIPLTVQDYCFRHFSGVFDALVEAWDSEMLAPDTPLMGEGHLETRIEIRALVALQDACRVELDCAGESLTDWDKCLPNEADAVSFVWAVFRDRSTAGFVRSLAPRLTAEEIDTLRRWCRAKFGPDMDHCFPVVMDTFGQ